VGSGGFCLTPVIACLFFVAGMLSMLEMQVSHVFNVYQYVGLSVEKYGRNICLRGVGSLVEGPPKFLYGPWDCRWTDALAA
jgi:hypothetical protein